MTFIVQPNPNRELTEKRLVSKAVDVLNSDHGILKGFKSLIDLSASGLGEASYYLAHLEQDLTSQQMEQLSSSLTIDFEKFSQFYLELGASQRNFDSMIELSLQHEKNGNYEQFMKLNADASDLGCYESSIILAYEIAMISPVDGVDLFIKYAHQEENCNGFIEVSNSDCLIQPYSSAYNENEFERLFSSLNRSEKNALISKFESAGFSGRTAESLAF